MPRPRDTPKCLPCRESGLVCQPEHLDETDVLHMSERSIVEAKATRGLQPPLAYHTQTRQDDTHTHGPTHSDGKNLTPKAIRGYHSGSRATLQPQPITPRPSTYRTDPAVSTFDLEYCRQALRKTFQDCDKTEFRLVTRLISCILSCARWLSRREILAAVTLFDPERTSERPANASQRSQGDHWLRKCNLIIMETLEGNMAFRSSAMEFFLRKFMIKGVDTSHRTLALICRRQREFEERCPTDIASLNNRSDVLRAAQVLSPYVSTFGDHHLKAASLTSIISNVEEDVALFKAKESVGGTSDDLEIIQNGTQQLSLREEKNGWMLLSPTPAMTPPSHIT